MQKLGPTTHGLTFHGFNFREETRIALACHGDGYEPQVIGRNQSIRRVTEMIIYQSSRLLTQQM